MYYVNLIQFTPVPSVEEMGLYFKQADGHPASIHIYLDSVGFTSK